MLMNLQFTSICHLFTRTTRNIALVQMTFANLININFVKCRKYKVYTKTGLKVCP